ncbi:FG-GAP repeat protein [Gemmata obscuriglobus]|uniref:Right handed beta helix domain-containing protein n=1 Tax=Gemmata obscuriglobus TaxID=114 RepID=A0A2Z3HI59_9BACT|nr:FG-GAP-like repeat-containing protein [Gemmata obscuriglobus]AWM41150.1 hypothetical protein C1280_31950 [Gemmata obscuriglobus]QEG25514.1 FG-GAP repeat protein [Gemmata obscuriglobus]VTR98809.1 VCBS repeat-containing protein OS=Singulisphaera acidiphila (strain ATCC BAA-1392 / DSM 18658 / VKM B-2454 / MOB10) GN=Sinac_4765 PE=4 SV=1: VCBS [Gemmata obscuriglobus UQM 2246]
MPATINVTGLGDAVAPDSTVTLREAIRSINGAANVNTDVVPTGAAYGTDDTITFTGLSGTIVLAAALDPLDVSVTINGTTGAGYAGAPVVTVDGNGNPTFAVNGQHVTIRGLSIVRSANNGITVQGPGASGVVIAGNYIGVRADGTTAAPNEASGVLIDGAANGTVGGTVPADRNVISGNVREGVVIQGSGASGNVVAGNHIGTNAAGTAPLGNATGVYVLAGAANNTIGGTATGARNVISGNTSGGVVLQDAGTTGNLIAGNYIGIDAGGTTAVPNPAGVLINGAANNTVGGTVAGARNVISGNASHGVSIQSPGTTGNVVQGNFIGTNAAGTAAVGNASGVVVTFGPANNTIGGTTAGSGNVISGNTALGVQLATVTGIVVAGNYIGTDPSGTAAVANGLGVLLSAGAVNNTIGGTSAGAGNVIAFNGGAGVALDDSVGATGLSSGASILGNAIFSNGALGIDLRGDGVTANDAQDSDTGVNSLQNYPLIASVVGRRVSGHLAGAPNASFRLEFFSNPARDPSGFGQGKTFLGAVTVATDGAGVAAFLFDAPADLRDQYATATATDLASGDTSEFGNAVLGTGLTPLLPPPIPSRLPLADPEQVVRAAPVVNTPLVPPGVEPVVTAGHIAPTAGVADSLAAKPVVVVGPGPGGNGVVRVINGDGTVRADITAFAGFAGGVKVATADVTGDGAADLVVGTGAGAAGGHVKVFDGATGELVYSFFAFAGFAGGVDVTGGDINADGFDDIIVGAGAGAPGGHVKVYDGRTGAQLASFFSFDAAFLGGVTVAAGDFNADGLADVVVGAGPGAAPHVKIIEATSLLRVGSDGQIAGPALLASFFAFDPTFRGGVDVTAGADFVANGVAELVVGAGSGGAPHVKVINGTKVTRTDPRGRISDDALLASFFAFDPAFRGGVRLGEADVDQDGIDELVIGAGRGVRVIRAPGFTDDVTRFDALSGGADGAYVA